MPATRLLKLSRLSAKNYRSLRDESIELNALNVFIGANASGKSTILDALRFLHEGIQTRDFRNPVFARGGIVHLAWKGEAAAQVELVVRLEEEVRTFEWSVRLVRDGYEFHVEERVDGLSRGSPSTHLLESRGGEGWWWSGEEGERVELKQARTSCALAAAAADASFPARDIAEYVRRWGFFDPNPFLLRRDWASVDSDRFDPYGRNPGETLPGLPGCNQERFSPNRWVASPRRNDALFVARVSRPVARKGDIRDESGDGSVAFRGFGRDVPDPYPRSARSFFVNRRSAHYDRFPPKPMGARCRAPLSQDRVER